jgi:DNA polymerase
MRVVLDFETYYDDKYSLQKMPTLEYVRDERFQVHLVGVKVDDEETRWLSEPDFRSFLEELPADVEVVCHNMYFDGLVLFHHYQFVPGVYRDTLSMARALLIHAPSHGLDELCKLLNLGEKVPEVLQLTKGMRTLSAEIRSQLGEYAINDVDLTAALYDRLYPGFPDDELKLVDVTMRWACRPTLHVDLPRLAKAYRNALRTRRDLIKGSGTTLGVLSSQQQFRLHLEHLGIEIPLKKNSKGKEIPALAKNDLGFRQMVADYPEHKALFDGRLAAKSTLMHTRIKRIYKIGSKLDAMTGSRGTLPMPLKFYGAHTGRWSGADGLNPQNFTRKSELRKSIIAPPGWVILVADLKQIEARMNFWFCKEPYWLDVFASGRDVYTANAATHFGIPYEEVTGDQRFFGKTLELGLGYNMGWRKFRVTSALRGTFLSEEEAYRTVMTYRNAHPNVVKMWQFLSGQLYGMYQEHYAHYHGPIAFVHEGILLPNGMRLDYTGLEPNENGDWHYGLGNKIKKIYGGLMLENIIQALARIVIGEQILAIEEAGITTVGSTHDEILMLVRESEADTRLAEVREIMRTPPDWCPGLPLDVDIGFAREYSK